MPILCQTKTSFTAGEISRRLLGRADLRAYDNGALALQNVFIHPTGGLERRAGLGFCASARGAGRLVGFEFNTEQTYLLALSAGKIDIFYDDTLITTVDAPWSADQIGQIAWTQSADTLLLCHPEVPPQKLTRTAAGSWTIGAWNFLNDSDLIRQPYYRFADDAVSLTPSATSGAITVTASAAVFDQRHQHTRLRLGGRQVLITGVISATQVYATVKETLASTAATTSWDEQAFSAMRGWPVSAAFHQDRLVIGGSRDLPNRLWLSRSADLWNFDLGTGLDDEAIEFGILSDQINAIRAVFSGRHLQVFTSGAEWMVTGDPLTPSSIQLTRQTRIGSCTQRWLPPRIVDGATLFVSRNGREVCEFLYTITEEAYLATDLALLARHLVHGPRDLDFDPERRLLLVVMDDGTVGVLTLYRSEEVTAWTQLVTAGEVHSVAVVGETVYVLVKRNTRWNIEYLDDDLALDAAEAGASDSARATWAGLDHLEGQAVTVIADDLVRAETPTVQAGKIVLEPPATKVVVGLRFTHVIEPLPPNLLSQAGASGGARVRLIEAVFRLEQTAAFQVDLGRGLYQVPLHRLGNGGGANTPPSPISGDVRLKALGWARDATQPLWRIEQDQPLPFTLLAVTSILKADD